MERATAGWLNGLAGVIIFSGSLPATRLAVIGFDPLFLTGARASIAGLLGLLLLVAGRERRPAREDLVPLVIVAVGCVLGFPLLTALALQHVSAAHSMIFVGALPLSTAIFAVVRNGERPHPAFWIFSALGTASVASYAALHDFSASLVGDSYMLAAIVVCGLGYAEGARLSQKLGGWQVISWALVLSLPFMLPFAILQLPHTWDPIGASAWFGLAYVSLFSMLIGFVFWYRGLAQGGVAAVSQLQLLQPFLGLALSAFLLHEEVTAFMQFAAAAVVVCVAGARRYAR